MLFASFDQRIDPAAVLATVHLRPSGTPVRLATPEEVKADEEVSRLAAQAAEGRWLAFLPSAPLPADTAVTVTVGPGTPSAEGPRKTAKAQAWSFRTYGPLKVVAHRCGWNDECPPFTPWHVEFTNPIDAKALKPELVRVSPELPGLKVDVYGETLNIRGRSKGRTTYRVTLAAGLRDKFGQTLGAPETLTFTVGSAPPMLTGRGGLRGCSTRPPPRFSVYSVNHDALKVPRARGDAAGLARLRRLQQRPWRDRSARAAGPPVVIETVRVQGVASAAS